jgi:tRNA1Val (adenine37-N6)-methyltransferase
MKPFRFQQFSIQQSKNVFRVGTDGVLLGALCSLSSPKNILEVGTGSGLISLMLAQRESSAKILAIDINSEAIELAGINFRNSPFSDRLKTKFQDFKNFESDEKFDLIVCNPPFFEENNSAKDILARQQVELNFENLIEKSSQFLF